MAGGFVLLRRCLGSPNPMDMSQRFTGVASLTAIPLLLVVNPALAVHSVAELAALNQRGRAHMRLSPKPMPCADIAAYLAQQAQGWDRTARQAGVLP